MARKLKGPFFGRPANIVARELLGKVIVRKLGASTLKAKIVEDEAYFGKDDPASWARFGKRKDNAAMWEKPGTILVKNVHRHFMLNFVTGKEGEPEAVLIRALEPLNFSGRCSGPGLLTKALGISKSFNGKKFSGGLYVADGGNADFETGESFRTGVKKDLESPLRFYIKGNKFVSGKQNGK